MRRGWVTKLDAQVRLAARLRAQLARIAGDHPWLSDDAVDRLPAFLQRVARAMPRDPQEPRIMVEGLIDQAVAQAIGIWGRHDPLSEGLDARYLSLPALQSIERDDPALGVLSRLAYDSVRDQQLAEATDDAPDAVEATMTTPHVDLVRLERDGDAYILVSLSIDPDEGPIEVTLTLLDRSVTLRSYDGRFSTWRLSRAMPDGYWVRRESETPVGEWHFARFSIVPDPPGTLRRAEALVAARRALMQHVRDQRVGQPDWISAAGIMDTIDRFGDPEAQPGTEVLSEEGRYLFIGPGPRSRYTEVGVDKQTGAITRVYVELD